MNKKKRIIVSICSVAVLVLCLVAVFWWIGGVAGMKQLISGFKDPVVCTWEDYQDMSNEEKDDFFLQFDSVEDFEHWKDSVQPEVTITEFSWDESGKQPDDYTWEEYLALSPEKKEAFYQWFPSREEFENWRNYAQPEETKPEVPVWNEQGKLPSEYTWAEYQALSPDVQDAFFLWFPSKGDFEAWMNDAKPEVATTPNPTWDQPGKSPQEYTWAEYEALTPEEQDAFFGWFGSVNAFEAWMDAAKPVESSPEEPGWNKPGKQPDAYTWEEYQMLSPEEQDAFFLWFEDLEAFETWADRAQVE